MIGKLRKERKTIWHISIVLMMMLVIVFLVASASGAPTCTPIYTPSVKVIDNQYTGTKVALVLTYRIPVVPVVTLRVYVKSERTITTWHYQSTSTPRTYCTINKRCEVSGRPVVKILFRGTTYGPWRPVSYYTTFT